MRHALHKAATNTVMAVLHPVSVAWQTVVTAAGGIYCSYTRDSYKAIQGVPKVLQPRLHSHIHSDMVRPMAH